MKADQGIMGDLDSQASGQLKDGIQGDRDGVEALALEPSFSRRREVALVTTNDSEQLVDPITGDPGGRAEGRYPIRLTFFVVLPNAIFALSHRELLPR